MIKKKYSTLNFKKIACYIRGETFNNDQTIINLGKLAESVNSYIKDNEIQGNTCVFAPPSTCIS